MGYRLIAAAGAIGLIWWASHGSGKPSASAPSESTSLGADTSSSAGRDLTDTDADTSGFKGGETYAEYDTRRNELGGTSGSYEDYGCTQDCSGHQAGYEWAEAHDITDASDCGGNSWSFQEGCVAYAEEQSGDNPDTVTPSDDGDDEATGSSDDDDDDDGPSATFH